MRILFKSHRQFMPLLLALLLLLPAMAFAAPQGTPVGGNLLASTTNTTTAQSPRFEPNRGQVADTEGNLLPDIKYVYRAPGMMMGLTKNGFIYNVYTVENQEKEPAEEPGLTAAIEPANPEHEEPQEVTYHYHRVEVEFVGANPNPQIIAEEQTSDYANYYLGHCPQGISGIYGYQKLIYKDLYPNIDLVLKRQQTAEGTEELKYDLVVRPGGNLSQVKMKYSGMEGLALDDEELKLTTSQGTLTESIPASYWQESGHEVAVQYVVQDDLVAFAAAEQQPRQTLVVDPSLSWSTYLGGSNAERGNGIATDGSGNAFVTGNAWSTNFPTSNAYQGSNSGSADVFLTKFSSSGSVQWSTYLGGSSYDYGYGVATDGNGNAFVTGNTESTDFPTSSATYASNSGDVDVFLTKFSSSGSVQWSTYLGGSSTDHGNGVATDGSGNAFVTGYTWSFNFPTSNAAYASHSGAYVDAFVMKFSSSGSVQWSTYLGGSNTDRGHGVATDGSGNVFVTGYTHSFNFPTDNAAYASHSGSADAFVAKFSSSGSMQWSTYLGGSSTDVGNGVATNGSGNAFVTGYTWSFNFPTSNAAYASNPGDPSAFATKFTICSPTTVEDSVTACESYTSPSGQYIWTTSGIYQDTLMSAARCDSILTIHLTLLQSTSGTETVTACESYTWSATGLTYTASGTYSATITNVAGCDSTATLDLTVLESASTTLNATACDRYISPSGSYIWTTSGTYTDTLLNRNGCDSLISVHLTILGPSTSTISAITCNPYISPSGKYTWTTSGTYTDTLTNIRGCDSLITVHLTIEAVDTSVTKSGGILTALAPNASYQWLDCNSGFATISGANSQSFTPGADGSYAVEVTQNGCTDTSNCYSVTIVGLADQNWDLKPSIVPNPTTGKVTLQLGQPYEEITVTVFNALGAVVSEHHFFHRTQEVAFHLEGVPGIYFLRITTPAGHAAVVKVVKE